MGLGGEDKLRNWAPGYNTILRLGQGGRSTEGGPEEQQAKWAENSEGVVF